MSQIEELMKQARREYMRKWRQKNPEKVEQNKEYLREWRKSHPEKVKQYQEDFWRRKAEQLLREQETEG